MNCTIVRYSEIGLKGKNRSIFEKKLVDNIRFYLKNNNIAFEKIQRKFSRIIIYSGSMPDLSKIFGISSFSHADISLKDLDSLKTHVKLLLSDYNENTMFRVSTQRLDKGYELTSMQVDMEIGGFIIDNTNAKVSLKKYNKEMCIEILYDEAYVFDKKIKGPGGLPVGIEGTVFSLIDTDDSINAALLVMKRGCDVIPVGTKEMDISILNQFSPKKLNYCIIENINEINKLANEYKAKALVVGQKLKDFKEMDTNLIVFRPLIAM